jgi:hypothetical protein
MVHEITGAPSDLAEIVKAWPELPEHIKAAIKALIKTNTQREGKNYVLTYQCQH